MDSQNAPAQLRAILLQQNPLWKLPERRVARYLKRHLKARKDPTANEIEADEDEATVYTTTSSMLKESVKPEALTKEEVPEESIIKEEVDGSDENGKKEDSANVTEDKVAEEEKVEETPTETVALMDDAINEDDEEGENQVVDKEEDAATEKKPSDKDGEVVVKDAYVDDNDKSSDGIACFGEGCIIS